MGNFYEWNHTLISLVPKSAHVSKVTDYRSISCCTMFYKMILKILATKLSGTLDELLHQSQAAFVQGRLITDNIHLAQELFRKYHRKQISPRCIMKIDLQKAFDSVHWDFLHETLVGLDFPERFIAWIMECVTTISFSMAINEGTFRLLRGARGPRQGDPLSPYLFGICIEIFRRQLQQYTAKPGFTFHPRCAHLRLAYLAYADNLLLLSRGDATSIGVLSTCLQDFGAPVRLQVNKLKSCIYLVGVDVTARRRLLSITFFRRVPCLLDTSGFH